MTPQSGNNILPTLSLASCMQARANWATELYKKCTAAEGGEKAYSDILQDWACRNPKSVKVGRPIKDTHLGKHIEQATSAGMEVVCRP
jgi:hypothetical protein